MVVSHKMTKPLFGACAKVLIDDRLDAGENFFRRSNRLVTTLFNNDGQCLTSVDETVAGFSLVNELLDVFQERSPFLFFSQKEIGERPDIIRRGRDYGYDVLLNGELHDPSFRLSYAFQ